MIIRKMILKVDLCVIKVQRSGNSRLPAIVALSHPCKRLPIAAAMATSTAPLMFDEFSEWV